MTKLRRLRKRKRGRPPLSPELDPDQTLIRIADALQITRGWSEQQAIDYVLAWIEADVFEPLRVTRGRKRRQGWTPIGFKLPHTRFDGRRSTLRKKAEKIPREERRRQASFVAHLLERMDRHQSRLVT